MTLPERDPSYRRRWSFWGSPYLTSYTRSWGMALVFVLLLLALLVGWLVAVFV